MIVSAQRIEASYLKAPAVFHRRRALFVLAKSSDRCGSQLDGDIENGTDHFVIAGAPAEVLASQ
jgi:hypothetical protein